jgi:hypothetical protein
MIDPKKKEGQETENPLIEEIRDSLLMREMMSDLFEEDKVSHKHGGSEPEKD